jgi:hypothetical protein
LWWNATRAYWYRTLKTANALTTYATNPKKCTKVGAL